VLKAVVPINAAPPLEALYHFKLLPVATRSATVAVPQKLWALAVGAKGLVTVTATAVRLLSHPFTVWLT
jgi:hypothetical protein